MKSRPGVEQRPRLALSILALSVSAVLATQAQANPVGARVVHGNVGFSGGAGELTVTNSPGSIINWQGFSIGRDEVTRFIQQNHASAVLNRVTGGLPSEILGSLLSNGRVFLINQNGIVFGDQAIIDTAGFVASSLNMSDADFLAGRLRFEGDGGAIENRGYIRVGHGGDVMLIAPDITNSGIIRADDGRILLAAGRDVVIESLDYEHVRFRVQAPGDRVLNLGQLIAANGVVSLFAGTLEHRGLIEANRVSRDANGIVHLEAGADVTLSGRISATGRGERGGDVTITGRQVEISGAGIDVSGDLGGGRVRIGGDYQGRGELARAERTRLDQGSTVRADALGRGDGGEIIVWSEQETATFAHLSARGGPGGGDGGLVETSSRGHLTFGQPADAAAPAGRAGTWLLDPEDILIGDGEAASISEALNQGSNVSLRTADSGDGEGNITVASPIAKTQGDDAALSMQAHNRIDVNASITSTSGKLDVSLKAGKAVHVNADVDTNGGRFSQVITDMALALPEIDDEGIGDSGETDVETGDEATVEAPAPDSGDEAVAEIEPETEAAESVDIGEPVVEVPVEMVVEVETAMPTVESDAFRQDLDVLVEGDVVTRGGDIFVDAGREGTVGVYGRLDASSESGKGGDITVLGENVGLFEDAVVDASGDSGGGQVLIGGDQQGRNPDIPNATAVYTGRDTRVSADATGSGDGGRVIIYGDDSARVYGGLSARGGPAGGDGGFIETSGRRNFDIRTSPDVSAPGGQGGTWLIDPATVTIVEEDAGGLDGAGSIGDPFRPVELGSNTINYTTILDALAASGGGTVRIVTECDPAEPCGLGDGDIIVDFFTYSVSDYGYEEGISSSTLAGSTLILHAANDIVFNDDVTDTYGGGLAELFNLHVLSDAADGETVISDVNVQVNDFRADSHVVIDYGGWLEVGGDAHFERSLRVTSPGGFPDSRLYVYGSAQFDGPVDIEVLDDLGFSYISLYGGQGVFDGDVTLTNDFTGGETGVYLNVYNDGTDAVDAMFNADVELNEDTFIQLFEDAEAWFNDTFTWNGGTLVETDSEPSTFFIRPGAVATLNAGVESSLFFDNARLVNQGTVNWLSGNIEETFRPGWIENEGTWNKIGSSLLDVFDEIDFENRGEFNIDEGTVRFRDGNFVQTEGSLNLLNGGTIRAVGGESSDGTLYVAGGSITGDGTVDADVCVGVDNDGCDSTGAGVTIAPGASLGTLNFSGDLPLTATSRLEFELGAPPGVVPTFSVQFPLSHEDTGADAINVAGELTLGGATIAIGLLDGFVPSEGDLFTLLYVGDASEADAQRVDGQLQGTPLDLAPELALTPSAAHIASYVINVTIDSAIPPAPLAPPAPGNGPPPPSPPAGPGPGPVPGPGPGPDPGVDPPVFDPIVNVVSNVENNPPSGLNEFAEEDDEKREIGMCTG